MDRKSVTILLVCVALLLVWPALVNRIFPPSTLPATNSVRSVTNQTVTTGATTSSPPTTVTSAAVPSPVPARRTDVREETATLENESARYTFTSLGGGLRLVELKKYPANVGCNKDATTNGLATLNTKAPSPALALFGGEAIEGDGIFTLSRTGEAVRAEKVLPSGLALVKEFRLSTNYLLSTTTRLENRSAQPLNLPGQEWVIGTATPIGQHDESLLMGAEWFDGQSANRVTESWFANRAMGCGPSRPRSEYQAGTNVVWAAVHNQFFAMIAVPATPAPQVVSRRVPLPRPSAEQLAADSKAVREPFGYQTALLYPAQTLAPGQALERKFDVFAGPKEYYTLSLMPKNQDLVMGFDGFFGWFAKALLLSMNGIHSILPNYGLAIIVITIIIKLLFWPLTAASTRSMKRMAELQPQMKALQEKYKDDPAKMNQKLMEFMREKKVSPLGGCLPMLLQIPVFFGFYRMLQSAIELRGASFLWACDLSQPDTIFFIPGLHFPVNPMPLLMGATMIWQAQLTPPSPGMDPVQQKIMRYMPLMFMVFLYNFSAGLTLYWTVQNLMSIAQMKLTKARDAGTAAALPTPPARPGGAKKK